MARGERNRWKDDIPKGKVNKSNLKRVLRIFSYVRPYWAPFTIAMIFLFITGGTALVFPQLMGDMIDAATMTTQDINKVALILLIVFFVQAIASYFRIYLFAVTAEKALAKLRQDTYAHVITLPMVFFSTRRVGELNSRIAADLSMLAETFSTTLAEFIRQIIIIVGGLIILTLKSGELTLVMLCIVPLIAIAAVFFGNFIRKLSRKTQDQIADSNTIVEETFQGISNVKSFANESYEIGRYKKVTNIVIKIAVKGAQWRGGFASFIIFCLFGSIIAVVWYGTLLVNDDLLSMGNLISFVLYTVFMGASIAGIASLWTSIQKAIGATEELMDIMDEKRESIDISGTVHPIERLQGHVAFENVSFSYPNREEIAVLESISFSADPGEQIAIVGPSGAGKSTIVSLLLRFYDTVEGTIRLDGKSINEFNLTELRSQMAVVPQDVLLFGGTIKENIAYGKPEATDDEIHTASEKANATEFILRFPEKYETVVGERGVQLSGGQRQRIAIARAMLKDPSILILDEATSSLDSESERLVQEALDELMTDRTSFVIAHRLSTVRKANKILVIDKGEIKETGTHEQLIQNENGLYKSLSQLQFNTTVGVSD